MKLHAARNLSANRPQRPLVVERTDNRKKSGIGMPDGGTASVMFRKSDHGTRSPQAMGRNAIAENPAALPGLVRHQESDHTLEITLAVGGPLDDPRTVTLVRTDVRLPRRLTAIAVQISRKRQP